VCKQIKTHSCPAILVVVVRRCSAIKRPVMPRISRNRDFILQQSRITPTGMASLTPDTNRDCYDCEDSFRRISEIGTDNVRPRFPHDPSTMLAANRKLPRYRRYAIYLIITRYCRTTTRDYRDCVCEAVISLRIRYREQESRAREVKRQGERISSVG